MKIKQIKNIVLLSSLALFTACVDQNSINLTNEKKMKEEQQRVYIDRFPVQTYEEYLALDKFTLDKYLPQGVNHHNGTVYLKDGTKIKYNFNDRYISETITNIKKPFIETRKGYYPNKKIKIIWNRIDDIEVGEEKEFNYLGGLEKLVNHEQKLRRDGMDYKKVLAWAEDMGFLDVKHARVVKGDNFTLQMHTISKQLIEIFENETSSTTDLNNFLKYKNVWTYIVESKGKGHYFYISGGAESFLDMGNMRYLR